MLYKGGQTLAGIKSIVAALGTAAWLNQTQTLPVLISVQHIDSSLSICHTRFQWRTLTSLNTDQAA